MPRIPGPQDVQQVTARPVTTTPPNLGADTRAIMQVAEQVGRIGQVLNARRQAAEDAGASAFIEERRRSAYDQVFEANKSKADSSDNDYISSMNEGLTTTTDDLLRAVKEEGGYRPSKEWEQKMRVSLASVHGDAMSRAATYENNVRVKKLENQLNDSLDQAAFAAFNDPDSLRDELNIANGLIEQGKELFADSAEKKRQTAHVITTQGIRGLIARDPARALRELRDEKGIANNIETSQRIRLIQEAENEIQRVDARVKTDVTLRTKDALAAYQQGLAFENPPTKAEFMLAYPEDGARRFEEFDKWRTDVGEVLPTLAMASPKDQRESLERLNPAGVKDSFGVPIDLARPVLENADGTFSTEENITVEMNGKFVNIPTIIKGKRVSEKQAIEHAEKTGEIHGEFDSLEDAIAGAKQRSLDIAYAHERGPIAKEGFAADMQRFRVLIESARSLGKAKQTDPIAYLNTHSDEYAQAFEAVQKGDITTDAYASMVLAEQERLGVEQPRLLPEEYSKRIAASFNEEGGRNANKLISELSNKWGNHWPQVYKQLSKDLPGSALVIAAIEDDQAKTMLGEISNLKTEELKTGLNREDVRTINDKIDKKFVDMQRTLASNGNPGIKTYTVLNEQTKRLTYSYVARGDSVSDAVNKAYKSIIDDQYELVDTYRIPRKKGGIELNVDNIRTGAFEAIKNMTPETFGFDPKDPEFKGMKKGFVTSYLGAQAETLKNRVYWVTDENETGLVLYDNLGALTTADGRQIRMTWSELQEMSDKDAFELVFAPGERGL